MRVSRDWVWFCFSLVEKVARALLANHRAQQSKTRAKALEITFDAQLKTALFPVEPVAKYSFVLKYANDAKAE